MLTVLLSSCRHSPSLLMLVSWFKTSSLPTLFQRQGCSTRACCSLPIPAKMTAVGSVLIHCSSTLISNIDKNLNYIWRVLMRSDVRCCLSLCIDGVNAWAYIGGCEYCCYFLCDIFKLATNEVVSGAFITVIRKLPLILSFFAFFGLYLLVPTKIHSFMQLRALVAALLFELSKKGFARLSPQFSYQLIYGALAAIPDSFRLGVFVLLIVPGCRGDCCPWWARTVEWPARNGTLNG